MNRPSIVFPVSIILLLIVLGCQSVDIPKEAKEYRPYAYGWGFAALGTVWLLLWLFTKQFNPFKVVIGADGRPSTSKFKPFLWFLAIFFSYAVLYSARIYSAQVNKRPIEPIKDIPVNVLIALGFSVGTWVAAKNITETQLTTGQLNKTNAAGANVLNDNTAGAGAILQDDNGFPDLGKIQTVGWTLLAIVTYLVSVDQMLDKILVSNADGSLPDIDTSLMVLTGLGDAAYLGKKLVTTKMPIISRLEPITEKVGAVVKLIGANFGATQLGSRIRLDETDFTGTINSWADTEISFTVPTIHPKTGANLTSGTKVNVSLVVNGQETNRVEFTVA